MIRHSNTLFPRLRLMEDVEADVESETEAFPAITRQTPVPTVGTLATMLELETHTSWSTPTAAGVGGVSRVMVTSSEVAGQVPLAGIFQRYTDCPKSNPFTKVVGIFSSEKVPLPFTTSQNPVRAPTVFPSNLTVSKQMARSSPALAGSGGCCRVMVSSSIDGGQLPLVTVQRKTVGPIPKFETEISAFVESEICALPLTKIQFPKPITGGSADSVAVETHTEKSFPITAVEGSADLLVSVSSNTLQVPFVTVHRKRVIPV